MSLVLVLTHIACALLGVFTGACVVVRAVRYERGETMPERKSEHHTWRAVWGFFASRSGGVLSIVALLGAIILIAVQQDAAQRAMAEHDDCVARWGRQMVDVVQQRSQANAVLEAANQARDDALDHLLTEAISQTPQPGQTEAEERQALASEIESYLESVRRVNRAVSLVKGTAEAAPFPELRCKN